MPSKLVVPEILRTIVAISFLPSVSSFGSQALGTPLLASSWRLPAAAAFAGFATLLHDCVHLHFSNSPEFGPFWERLPPEDWKVEARSAAPT